MYQSVAGQFFPKDPAEQKKAVQIFLKNAQDTKVKGRIKALIVPHAGWIYSGIVAAAGYKLLKSQKSKGKSQIKTCLIVGPSHREYIDGVMEGILDHSVEVQIPFIKEISGGSSIEALVYGDIDYHDLSEEIRKRIFKDSIVIVSSDLSHYYPYDKAIKIDSNANKYIPASDIKNTVEKVEACGITGILAIMKIAKELNWKGILLDYKNSGDTANNKDAVVGYGCYAFYV